MENKFPADRYSMISLLKRITIFLAVSLFCSFIFAEDLPRGYKNIELGMSLDETKNNLVKNSEFGYHGDRDVSLVPGTNKVLIETGVHNISVISEAYRNEIRKVRIDQAKTTEVQIEINKPKLVQATEETKVISQKLEVESKAAKETEEGNASKKISKIFI